MRETCTVEYNTYGLKNPIEGRPISYHRIYQDTYYRILDFFTLKKRIIGRKERIIIDEVISQRAGLEIIRHQIYRPDEPELEKRLEAGAMTKALDSKGLTIRKLKTRYEFRDGVKFDFTIIEFGGNKDTHLSVVGQSIDRAASVRDYLHLDPEGYMSLYDYLRNRGALLTLDDYLKSISGTTSVLRHQDSLAQPSQS